MEYFDRKEEVLEIQLTQEGKRLLSKGKFKPSYYEFFDDDILYETVGSGFVEKQNDSMPRIKETPRIKTQNILKEFCFLHGCDYFDLSEKQKLTAKQMEERFKDLSTRDITLNTLINDLFVQFNVHGAEGFGVNGIDLYTRVSVNCLLAVAGGTVIVEGLDGKKFEITLQAGTQPNTKFRIPDQGLYVMSQNIRGSLIVSVKINVPMHLSEEQQQGLKNLFSIQ